MTEESAKEPNIENEDQRVDLGVLVSEEDPDLITHEGEHASEESLKQPADGPVQDSEVTTHEDNSSTEDENESSEIKNSATENSQFKDGHIIEEISRVTEAKAANAGVISGSTTGPELDIDSLAVDKTEATVGDTVTITVRSITASNEINRVTIRYNSPT